MIGIGLAIPFACSMGSMHSFGLMFSDFLEELNAGTSAVTMIIGILSFSLSLGGIFASVLFKKFSLRFVGVIGAVFYTLGSVIVVFATSVEMLMISYGVLQGEFRFIDDHF